MGCSLSSRRSGTIDTHTHSQLCGVRAGKPLVDPHPCENRLTCSSLIHQYIILIIYHGSNNKPETDVCVSLPPSQDLPAPITRLHTSGWEGESAWKGWMGVFLRREIVTRDMSWKSEIERDKEKERERRWRRAVRSMVWGTWTSRSLVNYAIVLNDMVLIKERGVWSKKEIVLA